jgi:serine/threonine-protein kinase
MSDFLERLQRALPERYQVERELGRGGMATVVLARERHPNRYVAIKVLEPGVTERLGHERFLREIDLLSSLTHPHIVPIFAAGEAGDLLYYVMPYIQGETLRERLRREGALPLSVALRIGAEVAEALQHAHANNVVHRDVKPENVLLHDGYAMVTDFGVARAISAAGTDQITETGIAVGTPAYMSPEQAAGRREIDGRTDTYALGCVLFEMVTGQPPFGSGPSDEVLARHITQQPPSALTDVPGLAKEVDAALQRALAKRPQERYPSAAEFAEVLMVLRSSQTSSSIHLPQVPTGPGWRRWGWRLWAAVALVAVLGVVGVWRLIVRPEAALSVGAPRYADSVSVVPARNLTGDEWFDRLGDARVYDVIANLQKIPELKTSAYVSVLAQATEDVRLAELGRALGVRLVLVPQFRTVDGRVRLEAELVEAETGRLVGSNSWWVDERNERDMLGQLGPGVVDLIAGNVGLAARPRLAVRTGPAHRQYVLGTHWLGRRTPAGIRRAIQHFRDAIRLDSTSAPAFAGLANAYNLALFYRYDIDLDGYEAARRSLTAVNEALRLDPQFARAYGTRGWLVSRAYGPTKDAARDFRRALGPEPNSAQSMAWAGGVLLLQGKDEEAVAAIRRAIDLDPLSPARYLSLAFAAFPLGDYDMVIEAVQRATELEPELTLSRAMEGRAMLLAGRADDCVTLELGPHEGVRAACLWALGRRDEATAIIDSLTAVVQGPRTDTVYTDVARVEDLAGFYGWIGDAEQAVRWVTEAYRRSPLGLDRRVLRSALFERVLSDPAVARRIDAVVESVWPRVRQRSGALGAP